jgi:hypothetical protein
VTKHLLDTDNRCGQKNFGVTSSPEDSGITQVAARLDQLQASPKAGIIRGPPSRDVNVLAKLSVKTAI